MSQVLRHVIAAITPASRAHAEGARLRVAPAGVAVLERLAVRLGGAQHTPAPRAVRRRLVVVAGDHGVGHPGLAMGANHPTNVALHAIEAGTAALAQVARSARVPIVVVDAGLHEPAHVPASTIALGRPASRDLTRESAMTLADATAAIEAGIALVLSLTEADAAGPPERSPELLDVLVLGALGVGAEVASAAILGAALGRPVRGLGDAVAEVASARGSEVGTASGLDVLARFGGPETGVLAGMILAAASMNIAIVLDGYATGTAALIAARLAPHVTGYLIAAHTGTFTHPEIVTQLGLEPIFEVGLGYGEGTGAVMIVPLLEQVAALATRG